MAKSRRAVRLGGIVAACMLSVGVGLALVFRFVTAETVSRVHTPELLGMVGLLVLPGLSAWAIHAERRSRRGRMEEDPTGAADVDGGEVGEPLLAAEPIFEQGAARVEGATRGRPRRAMVGRRRHIAHQVRHGVRA